MSTNVIWNLRWVVVCGVCLAGAVTPVQAQSQSEMNRESWVDFTKADAVLNKVYQEVLATLEEADKKQFVAAQRAWLAYRDAQAAYEADLEARGGSMRPLIYNGACTRLTEARVKEMKQALSRR